MSLLKTLQLVRFFYKENSDKEIFNKISRNVDNLELDIQKKIRKLERKHNIVIGIRLDKDSYDYKLGYMAGVNTVK